MEIETRGGRGRERERGKQGRKAEGYDSLVLCSCCSLTKINLSDLFFRFFLSRSDINEINQTKIGFENIVVLLTSRR